MSNKKRLYLIDNIKGLLIVLVVFGHISELFIKLPFNKIMYCIIYTFHMPAFVFCSGLFARYSVRKIRHYIVIYMLFQTVYTLLAEHFLPGDTYLQYHTPYWALWYIFSLICWLLLLPLFDVNGAVKKLIVLLLAVFAALLAGCDKQIGYMLSLSRTIVYLPYFLAGCYVDFRQNRRALAAAVKRWYVLVPALLIAALSVGYILSCYDNLDPRLYYGVFGYDLKGMTVMWRLTGYIAASAQELAQISEGDAGEYLGSLEDLEMLIRRYHLDQIYILQKREEQLFSMQKYVDLCIDMGVTVRMVVDFYKRRRADSYVSCVGTYPVITYHTVTLNTGEQVIKRIMDVAGGLAGIVLFSPVMLLAALAIKLDSPGPVIFRQTRVGKNGRTFQIYKFRSMYVDAEERKSELLSQNEIAGGVMFKIREDPRITRVGRILRNLSIDELPQFFNVLGGSMSLVGTRPPTPDEVEKYGTRQWRRISIKPGLTGMWQVNGRSLVTDFEKIVELDVEYIDNWSLMEDIRILCKTVTVLLKHADAY